jgi:hypothetical protein
MFDVAIDEGRENRLVPSKIGRSWRTGYVLGDWATAKGKYFWDFIHLPTGCSINVYPCHRTKAGALAHLQLLADGDAEQCRTVEYMLEKFGRGWGMRSVCCRVCDHGSECLLLGGHGDRHETQHGCVFYTR